VPTEDKVWGAEELDTALSDRQPVLLEWLGNADVPHYVRTTGIGTDRLDNLRRLLTD
jgi:hypothetical protein